MASYLVIFTGADATGGPAAVPSSTLSELKRGHRIISVISLSAYGDHTGAFVPIIANDAEIIQDNGQNFSAYLFVALIERP
jgi:hypothetical protein